MWASSTQWVRRPTSQHDALMRTIGKYVGSVLLSIPFALMITAVVDIFTNQLNVRIDWLEEYEGWIGLAAFFASLIVCTHWVFRTDNRHLALRHPRRRIIVTVILAPPVPDPIFPPFLYVFFFAIIGVPLGLIAWGLARAFGRHEPR